MCIGMRRIGGTFLASLAVAAVVTTAVGCGGGGATTSTSDRALPPEVASVVADWFSTAGLYCVDVDAGIGDRAALTAAVTGLLGAARAHPTSLYVVLGRTTSDGVVVPEESITMRTLLTSSATALRPCAPAQARRLDEALANLP